MQASIGKVDDDGTMRNANMMSISHLSDVQKTWATVAVFFFDFNLIIILNKLSRFLTYLVKPLLMNH
jgi:hypothetical protein